MGFFRRFLLSTLLLGSLIFFDSFPSARATEAQKSFAWEFLTSLSEDWIPFDPHRYNQAASQSFLAKPSRLQRWGVVGAHAEAAYNGILRTLILKPELLQVGPQGRQEIAPISELKERHGPVAFVRASTVIHELAHAEFDRMVLRPDTFVDEFLAAILVQDVIPWFERRRQGLSLHPWGRVAASEFFAYFRGDFVAFLLEELELVLNFNGLSIYHPQRCFRSRAEGEEGRFNLPIGDMRASYRDQYRIHHIWVQGKDVDLREGGTDPFLEIWQKLLWDQMSMALSQPQSRQDLVEWLNAHPTWTKRLQSCQEARTQPLIFNSVGS